MGSLDLGRTFRADDHDDTRRARRRAQLLREDGYAVEVA